MNESESGEQRERYSYEFSAAQRALIVGALDALHSRCVREVEEATETTQKTALSEEISAINELLSFLGA